MEQRKQQDLLPRRQFIQRLGGAALALGVAGLPESAAALQRCNPPGPHGQLCEVGLNGTIAHVTAGAVGGQHMTQWCWAACIEMVFRYYGYVVPQAEIVRQTWGRLVNMPGQPHQILANLNRPWRDARGRAFYVKGSSFDANPITASQDLALNMPLIVGTMGHAMVLTAMTFTRSPFGGGSVHQAIVRDPWPGRGINGRRMLTPQEWFQMSFLARIRVSRI